jgi:Tfp pilus assembly protein PilX
VSRRIRGERGYALVTALLVIFLLAVALGLLATCLQIRLRTTMEDAQRVVLSALADAAVAEAVANLAQSADYPGAPKHRFGGGEISSQVKPVSATVFRVIATAIYKGRQRVVEATVFRTAGDTSVRGWRRLRG